MGKIRNIAMRNWQRRKWRDLVGNAQGLAMTEFALSLPILMTLSIGFIELASYIHAHMRVSQIALSVADNTGRITQTIDVTDVDAAMIGARIAGEGINFGPNGRVIVSMVEENGLTGANAGQKITWQRCFGAKNVASSYGVEGNGATNATYATGFGPTGNKIVSSGDDGVMLVEVVYDYDPIFPVGESLIKGLNGKRINSFAAYPVRSRSTNALQNGFGLTGTRLRLCSAYSAT
jgi:TadE-like protein